MKCEECNRSLPDDSGCPWCSTAERALAPVVPIAPRLARERPDRPATADAPSVVPEGLREARRVLAETIANKTPKR